MIDKGENPEDSVIRELYEEAGIKLNKNNLKILSREATHISYYILLNNFCNNIIVNGPIKEFEIEIDNNPPKYGKKYDNTDFRYKWYNKHDFRFDDNIWNYTRDKINIAEKNLL